MAEQRSCSIDHSRKGLFDATVEGYCMVFKKKTDFCQLEVIRNKKHKPDILRVQKDSIKNEKDWNDKFKNMDDLLRTLREDKDGKRSKYYIEYRLIESQYDIEHIYVVISCKESIIEQWAEERDIDVPIDAREAIKCAQKRLPKFLLAKRTYLAPDPNDEYGIEIDDKQDEKDEDKINIPKCDLVQQEHWENIHIGYESILHQPPPGINIYDQPHNTRRLHPVPSAISHILYLRILYEMLTDDAELGGADFVIQAMFHNKYHPLSQFYALHQLEGKNEIDKEFADYQCVSFKWRSKGVNTKFLDGIRRYYGEQIAFYFAFLVHYTVWLYPLTIACTIWWIIETAALDISSTGEIFVVFAIILWSTLMIENWYRREWKLRYRWGMMRHKHCEIPRATFRGKYIISTVNGMKIETYDNKYLYWFKRIISIFISFICILIVVAVTVIIWSWQNMTRTEPGGNYLAIAIGMINSAQILLFNRLYTRLAVFLNEWEGHRLEEEYYNQLVIKRISFIVINSFYSLFYIAFFDNRPEYDDNTVRLEALRMQLIILFLMAIIYQNTLEIFFPVCCPRITVWCNNCCSSSKHKRKKKPKRKSDDEYAELISNSQRDLDINVDDEINRDNISELAEWNIDDILDQSELAPSPDVLDNTAEIIVLHGYVTLFIVVFPLMPLLGVINNYVELKVDKYNLINTQRPVPISSGGLGVWSTVLSVFAIVSIYSNLALITFRTDIIIHFCIKMENLFAEIEQIYWTNEDMKENQITFFFIITTLFVFIVVGIRMCIPPISDSTADDIARQEICQRELLHISRQLESKKIDNNNKNNNKLYK